MKQVANYKVLFVSRYSFRDEATGRNVAGCKVTVLGESSSSSDAKGSEVVTLSADYNLFDRFPVVPGDYSLTTQLKSSAGKATLVALDAAPCKPS